MAVAGPQYVSSHACTCRLRDELRMQQRRAAAQESEITTVQGQASIRERALAKAAAEADALQQRVLAAECALRPPIIRFSGFWHWLPVCGRLTSQ